MLSCEDESLLIRWDAFFVLDLGLDVFNGVCWLNVEGDGLSSLCFDENRRATSASHKHSAAASVLYKVDAEGSAIFELLSGKNESLLVWWDAFFVLDLGLDVLNGLSWLHVQGDGLSSECLYEDLHATSESANKMEGGFLLDVVV